MAQQTPAKRLFDLLVSRDFDLELLDSAGKPATDPAEAEIFSFDFVARSGKNYGTVVIMLGDNNDLAVYSGDNIGKTMEGADKQEWFDFLHQLKNFSVKNFLDFSTQNINRLRYSMQGQAAIKEGLFEGWSGNKHTSWNDKPEHVRLMIKHKRPIGEADARYRYIESLFVETSDGERFKLPFTKLAGGRAMCEHVRNGGKPYDLRGQHIASIVEEINVLSRFKRANHGRVFEGDTADLINETNTYHTNLNKILKGLGTHRGYSNYFECWNPVEITEQDIVVENIKNMFVRTDIDQRIEQALPILARITQQGHAMKEANIFESWANRLMEGTWAIPETPEQKSQLVDILSKEFPVGADATNATEQLYDLIGDDILFDQLETLADQDANADARQVVLNRLQELSDNPDVAEVIAQLNVDVDTPAEDPADELDAEVTADETGIEQDIEETEQLDEFLPALAAIGGEMAGGALAGELGLGALGTNIARQAGSAIATDLLTPDDDEVDETIDPTNPKDYEIPTYLRKQQGQEPLTLKDIQDKEGKAKAEYQKRLGVSEADDGLSRIKSLAGILAK